MVFDFLRRAVGQSVDRLRAGLSRTRRTLVGPLRSLLHARRLDAELLVELRQRLIVADLGVATTDRVMADLETAWKEKRIESGDEALNFLKDELKKHWPQESRSLRWAACGPTVILVTGVNGAGKTTSIAKLAHYLKAQGKVVLVAACDTFRAAAVDQLSIWAKRVGVEIVRHQMGADPAAVAFDACQAAMARKVDVLIIDTAGRLHTQDHLMRELGKMNRVMRKIMPEAPHESLLVLDATIGQNALRQAEEFRKAVDLTGLFLAKLDGTAKGGIVVAIRDQLDLPVKFIGVGEKPEDIAPFSPDDFVEALFAAD